MQKLFLLIAGVLGLLSVAIGAFGAHGLKDILEKNDRFSNFETAVKYQFYHVFAIIAVAMLMDKYSEKMMTYAGYSFMAGILFFSGSLYILSLTNVTKWGAVTPIGGLLFIIGWICMIIGLNQN